MAKDRHVFTVEGRGEFPTDMLRYDACWPYGSADAAAILQSIVVAERGVGSETRRINLSTDWRPAPTVGRWDSFGWRVVPTDLSR